MNIYSKQQLDNRYVQQQANEAFDAGCINDQSCTAILDAYKTNLYTPDYFIRIALALLTIVAVVFAALLLGMIFYLSSGDISGVLMFVLGVINYLALEILVKQKHYFNAGVDNVLMFSSAAFFVSAFAFNIYADQSLLVSFLSVLACGWMAIRFTDSFMAMLAYIALLSLIFLLYIKLGSFAKATAPFVMMFVSGAGYFIMKKCLENKALLFYHKCFERVIVLTLLSFYASANYFIVRETSNEVFNLKLHLKDTIPFGWLFWILTFLIPLANIVYGIRIKQLLFIRTGLILFVLSILTYRFYYSIMPAEVAMLLGGLFMVIVGYLLTRYLKKPRYGFVFAKTSEQHKEATALQALLLMEAAGNKHTQGDELQFGDGDFGGGGAGGKF